MRLKRNYLTFCAAMLALASLGLSQLSAADSGTLCATNEDIYFSCPVSPDKIVSICGSANTTPLEGYVQYRYGSQKNMELVYPEKKSPPKGKFFYINATEGSSNLDIIRFQKGDYRYMVYQAFVSGLAVLKGGKVVFQKKCDPGEYAFVSPKAEAGIQPAEVEDDDLK